MRTEISKDVLFLLRDRISIFCKQIGSLSLVIGRLLIQEP